MSGDIQPRHRNRKQQRQLFKAVKPEEPSPIVDVLIEQPRSTILSKVAFCFIVISFSCALGLVIKEFLEDSSTPHEANGALMPNLQGLPDNIYVGASSLYEETSTFISSISSTISSHVKSSENELLNESPLETQVETPPFYGTDP
ncbi:unnamed protein product [Lepeophtheirus salmonis]|uniref:(salmon louse) hypothetical protein n=1 Tax=Lepeophtheirus salmonis TaxID=72036 RepID=A0A7R8CNN9_LEPSM|nr:unnamed protein product [Lepeophtheirus salmonis]CAF2877419.1 unnamed protein product [Lepeophtheirus salmonis]